MAMLNNQMVILGLYDIDILISLILGLGVLYIYIYNSYGKWKVECCWGYRDYSFFWEQPVI